MLARIEDTKLKALGPYFVGQIVDYVAPHRMQCLVGGSWYAVRFEPKRWKLAKAELAERGFVPYVPLLYGPEDHGRGQMRHIERPMLKSYMFVKCEPRDWGQVKAARGVSRILGFEGRTLPVPDGAIEVLRLQESLSFEREVERIKTLAAARIAKDKGKSGIVWQFSPGDMVRIKSGPFAGFNAQLESAVDSHDRLKALVSLFGGQTRSDFSAFDIEAL